MPGKLSNPHCTGYVNIHNEEENKKFLEAMASLGIPAASDFGQVPERKWTCDSCGNEVREHKDGNCPVEGI